MVTDAYTKKFVLGVLRKLKKKSLKIGWEGSRGDVKLRAYDFAMQEAISTLKYELQVDK